MKYVISVFLILVSALGALAAGNPVAYEVQGQPYEGYFTSPDVDAPLVLLQAALTAAQDHGADSQNCVAMGYCFGGAAVLELARSGAALQGFVTFHGGLSTPPSQDYSITKGRLLILHGTADTHITMDDFARLAQELEQHNVPHEMTTYGGAPHAFTVFDSQSYRAGADQASWRRFIHFLEETLH